VLRHPLPTDLGAGCELRDRDRAPGAEQGDEAKPGRIAECREEPCLRRA
jgi:hypothetical protein